MEQTGRVLFIDKNRVRGRSNFVHKRVWGEVGISFIQGD